MFLITRRYYYILASPHCRPSSCLTIYYHPVRLPDANLNTFEPDQAHNQDTFEPARAHLIIYS